MGVKDIFNILKEKSPEYVEMELSQEVNDGKLPIQAEKLDNYVDSDRIQEKVRNGYMLLVKIKGLKDKDMGELKKVLGFPAILLITINSIMGTGIYFLPAVGVARAGPASLISWLIMTIIAIYIGMCFAELCTMFPKAGGVYEYSKQAYGRFTSFVIGWITFIAGNITIAMLVVGAIQYLLPYELPVQKAIISLAFILIFNYILSICICATGWTFNNIRNIIYDII